MVDLNREGRLAATFVTLADTLVVGFDMLDLLHSLVETSADLLDAAAAGIVLSDGAGDLDVVASTSENAALVDLAQVRAAAGPCIDCLSTGHAIAVADIDTQPGWSEFSELARAQGYRSAHSVPLRLRDTVIGALTLYRTETGPLPESDAVIAQSLADVATISILHERALRESDTTIGQLQLALDSRVLIEQAKGVLAWVHNVDMDVAFALLRGYARDNGVALRDVAAGVVDRSINI